MPLRGGNHTKLSKGAMTLALALWNADQAGLSMAETRPPAQGCDFNSKRKMWSGNMSQKSGKLADICSGRA